jgi:hypothetical protein
MNSTEVASAVLAALLVGVVAAFVRALCLRFAVRIVAAWVWLFTAVAPRAKRQSQRLQRRGSVHAFLHDQSDPRASNSDLAIQLLWDTALDLPGDLAWAFFAAVDRVSSTWNRAHPSNSDRAGRRRQEAVNRAVQDILDDPTLEADWRVPLQPGSDFYPLILDRSTEDIDLFYQVENEGQMVYFLYLAAPHAGTPRKPAWSGGPSGGRASAARAWLERRARRVQILANGVPDPRLAGQVEGPTSANRRESRRGLCSETFVLGWENLAGEPLKRHSSTRRGPHRTN